MKRRHRLIDSDRFWETGKLPLDGFTCRMISLSCMQCIVQKQRLHFNNRDEQIAIAVSSVLLIVVIVSSFLLDEQCTGHCLAEHPARTSPSLHKDLSMPRTGLEGLFHRCPSLLPRCMQQTIRPQKMLGSSHLLNVGWTSSQCSSVGSPT